MKSSSAAGCAAVIFIPFACVGLGLAGWSYYLVLQWLAMQSWQQTPATIEQVSMKGGSENSESGRVVAQYRYEFEGQVFTNDRVGLHEASDNIGTFQRRLYERLKPLKNVENGATCYVDPGNPQRAVLNRESRWEMFTFYSSFSFVFGGLGLFMISGLIRLRASEKRAESRMQEFPDAPWKWHERWADGKVVSNQVESVRHWTIAACWVVVCSIPPIFFSGLSLFTGDFWALIGLFSLGLTGWIFRGVLIRRRHLRHYGLAALQLSQFPMKRGEETTTAIVFEKGEIPVGEIDVTLKMVRRITRHNKSRTETAWEETQKISPDHCRIISDGLCIAVPVELPTRLPPASTRDGSATWKMLVNIPTSTAAMKLEFELPVA